MVGQDFVIETAPHDERDPIVADFQPFHVPALGRILALHFGADGCAQQQVEEWQAPQAGIAPPPRLGPRGKELGRER
jgi:hypothetical protein